MLRVRGRHLRRRRLEPRDQDAAGGQPHARAALHLAQLELGLVPLRDRPVRQVRGRRARPPSSASSARTASRPARWRACRASPPSTRRFAASSPPCAARRGACPTAGFVARSPHVRSRRRSTAPSRRSWRRSRPAGRSRATSASLSPDRARPVEHARPPFDGIPTAARVEVGEGQTSSYTLSLFNLADSRRDLTWGDLVQALDGGRCRLAAPARSPLRGGAPPGAVLTDDGDAAGVAAGSTAAPDEADALPPRPRPRAARSR